MKFPTGRYSASSGTHTSVFPINIMCSVVICSSAIPFRSWAPIGTLASDVPRSCTAKYFPFSKCGGEQRKFLSLLPLILLWTQARSVWVDLAPWGPWLSLKNDSICTVTQNPVCLVLHHSVYRIPPTLAYKCKLCVCVCTDVHIQIEKPVPVSNNSGKGLN